MKPMTNVVLCAGAWVLLGTAPLGAEVRSNPYQPIIDRNAFGLKPPPPPPDNTPPPPVVLPAKVILTGITSLFGPASKRALLEITEQEPGKPPYIRAIQRAFSIFFPFPSKRGARNQIWKLCHLPALRLAFRDGAEPPTPLLPIQR